MGHLLDIEIEDETPLEQQPSEGAVGGAPWVPMENTARSTRPGCASRSSRAVSTSTSPTVARRRAATRSSRRVPSPSRVLGAGRLRGPAARAEAGRVGSRRRGRVPRRGDPGGHPALRVRRGGVRPRPHAGHARDGCADRVRRPHHRHARPGPRRGGGSVGNKGEESAHTAIVHGRPPPRDPGEGN